MDRARRSRSGWPCGTRLRCETLAATKSIALAFLHAATQAPQPMHWAASIARSESSLGTGVAFASGTLPVRTLMKPPACWMRSNDERSTIRSRCTGNAVARHGSIVMVSLSLNCRICNWQAVVPCWPPWGTPLMTMEQVPQIPSRQSESNAIGSLPSAIMPSFTTSSISRKDISGLTSIAS